jgi:ribosome biogenesis GTPase A
MTIQWFPGHMTRARRQIEEKLKIIDIAIELLDARLPYSSRNPMIDEILGNKPRLILLNKQDLADPTLTTRWVDKLSTDEEKVLSIDANTGTGVKTITTQCFELMAPTFQKWKNKGMQPRPIRALIVGIPNVGKSTLINRLAGRNVAMTGDRPGITKGQQWIKVGKMLELLDTPGILWPKFEDPKVGIRLAASGAIRDEILHVEDIALFLIKLLLARYPMVIQERYQLESIPQNTEDSNEILSIIEAIGRKRGAVMSGGKIDLQKASDLLLRDLRTGKLGRISLETPQDAHV